MAVSAHVTLEAHTPSAGDAGQTISEACCAYFPMGLASKVAHLAGFLTAGTSLTIGIARGFAEICLIEERKQFP